MHTKDFYLHEDEEIIEGLEPVYEFKKYLFVRWTAIFLCCGVAFFISLAMAEVNNIAEAKIALQYTDLGIITWIYASLIAAYTTAHLEWKKRFYWITSNRLIISYGVLRHQEFVTNLYEISDLTMTRTFLQRKLRCMGLKIECRRGIFSLGGMPEPEGIHHELKVMIQDQRRREGLVF
jgi:uncharacterized membrane protein YdbT with pleckstrin-like domain